MSGPNTAVGRQSPAPLPPAPLRRRYFLGAGLAGTGLALTLPPPGWWPLGFLGLAVLARLAAGRPWRDRFVLGAVAGVVFFGVGLAWAGAFSLPGYGLLVVVEAGFLAAALVAIPPGRGYLLGFPAALVLCEWARGRWPLGGLPLGGLALGQVGGPLAVTAALAGALGVVAFLGLSAAGLATLRSGGFRRCWGLAVLTVVGLAVVVAAGIPNGVGTGSVVVGLVQGGGPRGTRAVRSNPALVLERHLAATDGLRPPVDLVLWPEDVLEVPGALVTSTEAAPLAALARRLDTTLVAGVVEDAPGGRFRNAAVAFGPHGSVVDRYDKVRLVPFGEYLPARRLVAALADLSAVPRDALPGRGAGLLRTPAGRVGVVISYEVFFSDRARAAIRAGGSVLLVPTNASSHTGSQVPAQELAAARLRAIETGRYVLQAAPTGHSAVIDPAGRVLAVTGLGNPAVLQRAVDLRSGATLYLRTGDGPIVGLSLLALGLAWVVDRRATAGATVPAPPRRSMRGTRRRSPKLIQL